MASPIRFALAPHTHGGIMPGMSGRSLIINIAILGWMLLLPRTGAFGQTEDLHSPVTREIIGISVNPRSEYAAAGRIRFVWLLGTYCREALITLPTNTPREDAWVQSEGNTTDPSKIRRLVLSPEYNRQRLRLGLEDCQASSSKFLAGTQGRSQTESAVRYEAASLLSLALTLDEFERYASRAAWASSKQFGLDYLTSVRRALQIAALRTLEGE